MQIKEKVVLLDFCETVVKFQTADLFVKYAVDNKKTWLSNIWKFSYRVLCYVGLISYIEKKKPSWSFNKRCILLFLKGFSEYDLDKIALLYYKNVLRPNFIPQTMEYLKLWQKQGFRIIILSGGYDIYLKYFAEEFNISDLICTKIKFDKGFCKGTFSSIDCLGTNKIFLLKEYLYLKDICIDKENSIAVSDSVTDLPMLNYVGNQLIIYRADKKTWHQNYGFENYLVWN